VTRAAPARLALVAALVVGLLLPGTALGADPAPEPVLPPAAPTLTVSGGGIAGGLGAELYVPTDADGQASLTVSAADDRTTGYQVDPLPPGWFLASGLVEGRQVGFSLGWAAGAPDAVITVVAVGADGQTSMPSDIRLVSIGAPPVVGDVVIDAPSDTAAKPASIATAAIPLGGVAALTWREREDRATTTRVVTGEHVAPTTAGCPTDGWRPDGAEVALSGLSLVPDDPTSPPIGKEVVGPAVTARLPLPGLAAGCHRFQVVVTDPLGRTASEESGVLLVGSLPAPQSVVRPPSRTWTGVLNLFRASAFVFQATPTWCVAAAALMMANLASGRADRSAETQRAYMTWAQERDGLQGTVGTNAVGWEAMLDRWSGTDYEALYLPSFEIALRTAAVRMARTRKPVGVIVSGGTHAWVLHGFRAQTDPAAGPATITAVYASGPLGSRQRRGRDPAPNARLTIPELRRQWRALGSGYANAGKWVIVAPVK
jgi:hypothetical protein